MVAALIAQIPGALEAVAAAPVASAATDGLTSGVASQVASPAEALTLWAAVINSAIASRLAERVRQSAAVATTSTSVDLGWTPGEDLLAATPVLTYTASIPINETFTVPGREFTMLGGTVDPISLTFSDGKFGIDINRFMLPQTTLRVPAVTVHLGSADTTVGIALTATVGGATLPVADLTLGVTGGIAVNVPIQATADGPIQIDGFDLTGITGSLNVSNALIAAGACGGVTCNLPFNVGVCSDPSTCGHTVRIPDIRIVSVGPLLTGVIGGPDTFIPINAEGGVGPVEVTESLLSYTIAGLNGGDIPFSVRGEVPVNLPITATVGDFMLEEFALGTASWTHNSIPSSFALWQTNSNWGAPAPWSDDVGTNVIIPVSPVAIPSILVQMPTVTALIGGPATRVPIAVTGSIGTIQAAIGLFGITVSGPSGREIPITATVDISVDVPVGVSATPIQISGAPVSDTPVPAFPAPGALPVAVGLPTPAQIVDGIRARVTALLDRVGSWLATLPASPLTTGLSDAVWLVRTTLTPVGVHAGRWGSASCVATKDCSGQDLSGANLVFRNLSNVDFTGAVLTRADLSAADLRQANLHGANLTGASIANANLNGATLTGANLTGVQGLFTATLTGADLSGLNFSAMYLGGKNFTGTNFTGAKLTATNFRGANLTGADLSGADLTGASLNGAALRGARGLATATLTGTDFVRADLSGVDLSGAKLSNGFLTDANLAGANLSQANMTNAHLVGASLALANLTDADLSYANLAGADLRRTILTGVRWQDTTCPNGKETSTGCSGLAPAPIVIPAIQLGQGGLSATSFFIGAGFTCRISCVLPQAGLSVTIGSDGPLPGANTGVVVDPISLSFLNAGNTALAAVIGGPGRRISLSFSAAAGPVTIPLLVPTDIPWHSALDAQVDVPISGTLSALVTSDIRYSLPFDVATWERTAVCFFGSCSWSGWTAEEDWARGDLGGVLPAITLYPATTFGQGLPIVAVSNQ